MALATTCQTPGATFGTSIGRDRIVVDVAFPFALKLDEGQAALVEANLHNALELVLAPLFRSST